LLGLEHADRAKLLPSLAHGLVHSRHVGNKDRSAGFDSAMILLD
jgi:hypothetical protein